MPVGEPFLATTTSSRTVRGSPLPIGQCMLIVSGAHPGRLRRAWGVHVRPRLRAVEYSPAAVARDNVRDALEQRLGAIRVRWTAWEGHARLLRQHEGTRRKQVRNSEPSAIPGSEQKHGLDVDIAIRFFGQYSYRISNPILFYTNVAGNFSSVYNREQIAGQLKSELLATLSLHLEDFSTRVSDTPRCLATRPKWLALDDVLSRNGANCVAWRLCPSLSRQSMRALKTSR